MTHAVSSNVRSFGYAVASCELWVAYKNTPGFYVYEQVSAAVHEALLAAHSKGSFLHRHVLDRYTVRHTND